jgi:hypothetical protein
MLLVMLGSAWAGISRINWIVVPSFLACTLYILETKTEDNSLLHYSLKPIMWVVIGSVTGLLAWYGYAILSGNPIGQFGIFFVEDLLWYRLLPNPTFELGVLPATLLASLPLLGLAGVHHYRSGYYYHFIRRFGISIILLSLFIVGLVVSTKIGGGNNIHNLDAYLLISLIVGSYIVFDKTSPDYKREEIHTSQKLSHFLFALSVFIPIFFALQQGKSIPLPDQKNIDKAIRTLKDHVGRITSRDDEILFIGERQLLTFNTIKDVPLIADYERVMLMEMAMGENAYYLNEFYQRIGDQEFALIISEPLHTVYKGRASKFGEENDVYVSRVSEYLLCYYEPVETIPKIPVQLLEPRSSLGDCE